MYVEYSDLPFFDTAFSQITVELLKSQLIELDNLKFYTKQDQITDEDELEEYNFFNEELISKIAAECKK